jgi:hypothetical protein
MNLHFSRCLGGINATSAPFYLVFVILLELRHRLLILHALLFLHFREICSFLSASGLWATEKDMGDSSATALLNEK